MAITRAGRHGAQWLVLERLFDVFRGAPWFKEGQPGSLVPGSDAAAQYVTTIDLLELLVQDSLSAADFETLYFPFQALIPAEELRVLEPRGALRNDRHRREDGRNRDLGTSG